MFKIGDKVQYNAATGSIGEVEYIREYEGRSFYYVRWVYGRDVHGEIMTATSGNMCEHELKQVTEEEYVAMRDSKGFST
jgi:hypothetical protein